MANEERAQRMRDFAESLDEAFPDEGWTLVVFDLDSDGSTSILSNVTPDDACDELGDLVESMKDQGHGRKH